MKMWRELGILLAVSGLCACSTLQTEAQGAHSETGGWNVATSFSTGDVRMVTAREHPVLHNQVVCSEPSPDIGKAVSASFGANVQASNQGSAALNGASAQALAELAGRSTALVGLRDALFRTCEAYANGVIGQDAYAMVTARYHELMAVLFLGQDISALAGALDTPPARANVASPATPDPAPPAAGAPGKPANGSDASDVLAAPKLASGAEAAPDPQLQLSFALASAKVPLDQTGFLPVADAAAGADPAAKAADAPANANPPGDAAPKSDATAATVTLTNTVTVESKALATLNLTRLYEDYADHDLVGVIMVACINNGDPTRLRATGPSGQPGNDWLNKVCGQLVTDPRPVVATLRELSKLRTEALTSVHGKVDPLAALVGRAHVESAPAPAQKNATGAAATPTDPGAKAAPTAVRGKSQDAL